MNKPLHYLSIVLLTVALTLTLTGCGKPDATAISNNVSVPSSANGIGTVDITIICLNGVKYWLGHHRLAPYVSPTTMTFEDC